MKWYPDKHLKKYEVGVKKIVMKFAWLPKKIYCFGQNGYNTYYWIWLETYKREYVIQRQETYDGGNTSVLKWVKNRDDWQD